MNKIWLICWNEFDLIEKWSLKCNSEVKIACGFCQSWILFDWLCLSCLREELKMAFCTNLKYNLFMLEKSIYWYCNSVCLKEQSFSVAAWRTFLHIFCINELNEKNVNNKPFELSSCAVRQCPSFSSCHFLPDETCFRGGMWFFHHYYHTEQENQEKPAKHGEGEEQDGSSKIPLLWNTKQNSGRNCPETRIDYWMFYGIGSHHMHALTHTHTSSMTYKEREREIFLE